MRYLLCSFLFLLPAASGGCGKPEGEAQACACPLAEEESCGECFEKVHSCCFDGNAEQAPQLADARFVCEADAACRGCCEECAAMSCEELITSGSCPADGEGG